MAATPADLETLNQWSCPGCAKASGAAATYPANPDVVCVICGRALDVQERLAVAISALVRRLPRAGMPLAKDELLLESASQAVSIARPVDPETLIAQLSAAAVRDAAVDRRLRERRHGFSAARQSVSRPASSLETALREIVRGVVREEARSALADHRAEDQARAGTKLLPLADAAKHLGLTQKALRSRIERGSVQGATKVGGRWHVRLRPIES